MTTATIHPLMHNSRHVWFDRATDPGPLNPDVIVARRQYAFGESQIDEVYLNAAASNNPQFTASPFFVIEQQGELHEKIRGPGEAQRFPVFDDLGALGCSDYYGSTLANYSGLRQIIGLATDRPGGFGKPGVGELKVSLRLLSLLLNTVIESDIKKTLAKVYLGEDPGQRVCAGMIHRGEVVSIEAAVWFSDLRNFTASGEELAPEKLVERLNDYFEIVARAIHDAGGEILKYIGDAVLAIFPVREELGVEGACLAAVRALEDATERLESWNARAQELGEPRLAHGVGLHIGTTSYGNIGSAERLDFTVIGRTVNIASRIESQCSSLGAVALCSREFLEQAGISALSVGAFTLKGVTGQVELHALR
ncbi:adenylate/guanylate cyclase domain-containing protein [Sphingomonas sp. HDW15A]|uniref:adenylate/guanylate cyclase domain-containing protein n=1 Tax=Sphingomonas sp. HDW15A TaxID=2714942 RepID=UPI001408AE54|nr:adenylate/guanylate cyclase domain-containing protein [Sphingomonas sp. HDW15A]QIK95803.1 adenylate/guanylate cyclase domain-containing protein [Sphingomonas sp. HDW15A]